uniref:Uncharacterized protein n=1 Tax=Callorhinchus milii TaxID=7868 RepID=A0A4W3GR70_CALMI
CYSGTMAMEKCLLKCIVVAMVLGVHMTTKARKILVVPVDGSHWINMKVLIEELVARGHQVMVLRSSTSWYIEEMSQMYRSLTIHSEKKLGMLENHEVVSRFVVRSLEIRKDGSTPLAFLQLIQEIRNLLTDTHSEVQTFISRIFEDLALLTHLEKIGFDLLLTDPFLPTGLMLAHRLKLPMVYNVRWFTVGTVSTSLTDRMSYRQRLRNAIQYFTGILLLC